jgi:high-affinity K+ transport system ATPase subunit B
VFWIGLGAIIAPFIGIEVIDLIGHRVFGR